MLQLLGAAAKIGAWTHDLVEDRIAVLIEPVLWRAGPGHELERLIRQPEQWLQPQSLSRWQQALAEVRSAGTSWDLVLEYRRENARTLWVRTMGLAEWAGGRVVRVHGILQDITALREVERQLLHAQKLETLTRMTPGITHDLRNVLTAIAGFGACASELLPATHPAQDDLAGLAEAVDRGARLARQLVSISREDVIQPVELDLSAVIGDLYSMLRRALGETVLIDVVHATKLDAVVVDRGQIEQVILNLALNARDAMPGGGTLTLSTQNVLGAEPLETATGVRPAGRFVELAVKDTGVGMDEVTLGRIFEPFFTTKPAGDGTGLGLASCQRILEQSGGFLGVASSPGAGSTFRVWLPARTAVLRP